MFLETAHPAKFKDTVEEILQKEIAVPEHLARCLEKTKKSIRIKSSLDQLKNVLLSP